MGLCLSTTSRIRSSKRTEKRTINDRSLGKQRSLVSIHVLDDDSLLNIFYLYRPFFGGEDEHTLKRLRQRGGLRDQGLGSWWYQLTHVCQRWRNLILGSASYLRLSLVCTNGTPVDNMLAHSPPLPLTVDYSGEGGITAEDEEGILLALEQRHRVRHLRHLFPVQILRKLVMAINDEFPILEYLIMRSPLQDNTALMLPETLQAPNLHNLLLSGFACSTRPRLHPTTTGLVTLCLKIDHQSAYFQPSILLQWISFMPQLENLEIAFSFPVPNRDMERQSQLTHTPITTHITLPNLRLFWFRGVNAYLEAVVCRITTPRLENLQIQLFNQLTFSLPCLPQFMNTTENLRFNDAEIMFKDKEIRVQMFLRGADAYAFVVTVECWHLDWQVTSVAQFSNALSQVFSAVEFVTLRHEVHSHSSKEHNDVDRIQWRSLLKSFSNVKTLRVEDGLVEGLSRCLRLEDGELPMELLPELQELAYSGNGGVGDAFTSFIDFRRNAGHPITLLVRARTKSAPQPLQAFDSSSPEDAKPRNRSAPQPPRVFKSSSPEDPRPRSAVQPKPSSRSDSRPTGPERPQSGVRSPTMSYPSRRALNSTVKQVLAENPQFRILVVGKRGSGKSSLINATFGVNMSVAPGIGSDINLAFRPDENHHLIVHEYSGLEPGDTHDLRTVQDFVTNRTDPNRAPAERLHAIWICSLTSDVISGSIGEGIDGILNMRRVPVVVAFTKSDLVFPHISGTESASAYAQCEQLCRSLFRKEARDVPAELVSVMPQYSALINNLIVTTDRFIMGSGAASSSRSILQGAKPRIAPVPLAWSVALRVSRDITIQASIEIGQSRYWRSLWSSLDFADQPLKSCVNIIHVDILEIWNLYDRHRYLSSNQFKINMSHIIKDLAIPAGGTLSSDWNVSGDMLADWVYDVYRGSQNNVRCVMGYIVDLIVILDYIFRTTGGTNVTENVALKVMGMHVRSGRRDDIHRDIASFVTETFSIRFDSPRKDLVLEKVIHLIRQYCAPPNTVTVP